MSEQKLKEQTAAERLKEVEECGIEIIGVLAKHTFSGVEIYGVLEAIKASIISQQR